MSFYYVYTFFDQQVPPVCTDFVCFETVNDFMKQMIQLIPSFKKRCFCHR